jgi:hypothetical protein
VRAASGPFLPPPPQEIELLIFVRAFENFQCRKLPFSPGIEFEQLGKYPQSIIVVATQQLHGLVHMFREIKV